MTMLQGLVNYYERLEETGTVAPPGYSEERISFAVVLAPDGSVTGVNDLRDHSGKRPQARAMTVPASFKRPGTASNPFFLWDKTSYVFGVVDLEKKTSAKDPLQDHRAFLEFHKGRLLGTEDRGLVALLKFLKSWTPERYLELRYADEMRDQNIVFRFGHEHTFLHDRPAAKSAWADYRASSEGARGLCLVTGTKGAIARLHPSIKGMPPPAQTGGTSIVSFNLDAFTSYGKEQGANAPVSERAAHAYATALNTLLSRKEGIDAKGRPRWKNRVQIGDATTVFWAEAEGGPEAAEAAERVFSWAVDPPPTDEEEAARVQSVLQKIEAGRPLSEIDPKLKPDTHFYVLGLSPNAARLSVRFFLESTFGELMRHMGEHYRDLCIEPLPRSWKAGRLPSARLLALQTASMRRKDNRIVADPKRLPSNLAGEVLRSILGGHPYPQTLLATTIERLKNDRIVTPLRVALVKASIIRRWRLLGKQPYGILQEKTLVALDPDHSSRGYQLGRLFATYERAQAACFDTLNASVVDKFYASAVATPQYVFPGLNANYKHHHKKIQKGSNLAEWVRKMQSKNPRFHLSFAAGLERRVGEILAKFDDAIPAQLSIEEQGLFVIGYYHQKFHRAEGPETVEPSEADIAVASEGEQDA